MSQPSQLLSSTSPDQRHAARWTHTVLAVLAALFVSLLPATGLLAQSDEVDTENEVQNEEQKRAENPLKPLDALSPQATYVSFLTQIELSEGLLLEYYADRSKENQEQLSDEFGRTGDLFDLGDVAAANRDVTVVSSFANLADIVNRLPPFEIGEFPDDADVEAAESRAVTIPASGEEVEASAPGITSFTLPDTEIVIVRVEEGVRAGRYVFSAETIAKLPDFRAQVADLPVQEGVIVEDWVEAEEDFTGYLVPRAVVDALPGWFDGKLFGSPLWKLLADLVVLAIVGGLSLVWHRLVGRRGSPGTVGGYAFRLTTPVVLLFLVTYARQFANEQINHSRDVAVVTSLISTSIIWLCLATAFWIVTKLIVEWLIASPRISDDSVDAHLFRMLGKVVSAVGAFTLVFVGLDRIGVPTIGIGLGAGVLGLAAALAATSTLENLLGGITVFVDKPFAVDDVIIIGDDLGVVENIGPRSTRIRKFDDTRVTMPNSDISRAKITNLTERRDILFKHVIGVRYETTVEQLERIVAAIDTQLRAHYMVLDETDFPRVYVVGFGASSIDIDIRAHVATEDRHVFTAIQQELLLLILQIVEAAGSGFAFPSSTTYLVDDAGLPSPLDSDLLQVPSGERRMYTPSTPTESDGQLAEESVADHASVDGD